MKLKQGGQVIAMELETSIPQLKESQIMKSELQAKFLQHLLSKKQDNEGFTLIELLVVIIIIGILAAIALPSFLNQAAKARASESKTYVGSMVRGQQAYYVENQSFGTDIAALKIGVPTQTENYSYGTKADSTALSTSTSANIKPNLTTHTGTVTIDATGNAVGKVTP